MDAKLFQLLAKSLKEAAAISRGEAQPARAFAQKEKNSTDVVGTQISKKINKPTRKFKTELITHQNKKRRV